MKRRTDTINFKSVHYIFKWCTIATVVTTFFFVFMFMYHNFQPYNTSSTENNIPLNYFSSYEFYSRDKKSTPGEELVQNILEKNYDVGSVRPIDNMRIISTGKPVNASVIGNLGPPSVVTNENVYDWLKDRWQAALNMQGEPIPGVHWLEIDLLSPFFIRKILIDWEDAYSEYWTIMGRRTASDDWLKLCVSHDAIISRPSKKHIWHTINIAGLKDLVVNIDPIANKTRKLMRNPKIALKKPPTIYTTPSIGVPVRYVKLIIEKPATRWGCSIWRWQIWGYSDQDFN